LDGVLRSGGGVNEPADGAADAALDSEIVDEVDACSTAVAADAEAEAEVARGALVALEVTTTSWFLSGILPSDLAREMRICGEPEEPEPELARERRLADEVDFLHPASGIAERQSAWTRLYLHEPLHDLATSPAAIPRRQNLHLRVLLYTTSSQMCPLSRGDAAVPLDAALDDAIEPRGLVFAGCDGGGGEPRTGEPLTASSSGSSAILSNANRRGERERENSSE